MAAHNNIATMLTWIRVAAIPFVVLVFYLPFPLAHPAAAVIFILAAITDGSEMTMGVTFQGNRGPRRE